MLFEFFVTEQKIKSTNLLKIKSKGGSKFANTCQRKDWIRNMPRRKKEKIEKENTMTGAILKKTS